MFARRASRESIQVQTEIRRLCVERSGDDVKTPFLVAAVASAWQQNLKAVDGSDARRGRILSS